MLVEDGNAVPATTAVERSNLLAALKNDESLRIATFFPIATEQDPVGWYIGKPLRTPLPKEKDKLWCNFPPFGSEVYSKKYDIKLDMNKYTLTDYKKTWVLCCNKKEKDNSSAK